MKKIVKLLLSSSGGDEWNIHLTINFTIIPFYYTVQLFFNPEFVLLRPVDAETLVHRFTFQFDLQKQQKESISITVPSSSLKVVSKIHSVSLQYTPGLRVYSTVVASRCSYHPLHLATCLEEDTDDINLICGYRCCLVCDSGQFDILFI